MNNEWVDQIDKPLTNRKARRHSKERKPHRGFTKSNKKKRGE